MIRIMMFAASLLTVAITEGIAIQAKAPATAKPGIASGKALFVTQCGGCHLDRGFGTRVLSRRVPEGQAMLEAREDLNAMYVTTVVRHGIGSMPQFRKAELSDADLNAIATYLEKSK